MPTYYEVLKIQPQATPSEIQTALDKEYNNWRRLITHHDPAIVEQANQSLRLLEQIRVTLTNPAARDVYDTALGLKGPMAGLADPEAILRASPPTVFPVAQSMPPGESVKTTTEAWICRKCHTPNRIGLKFCSKCGTQLGRECIKCNQMVSVGDAYCPYCGVDIAREQTRRAAQQQEMERQKEMEEAARLAQQREIERQQEVQRSVQAVKEQKRVRIRRISAIIALFLLAIGGFFLWRISDESARNEDWGRKLNELRLNAGTEHISTQVNDSRYYVEITSVGFLHSAWSDIPTSFHVWYKVPGKIKDNVLEPIDSCIREYPSGQLFNNRSIQHRSQSTVDISGNFSGGAEFSPEVFKPNNSYYFSYDCVGNNKFSEIFLFKTPTK